jgi:hypothetical protein
MATATRGSEGDVGAGESAPAVPNPKLSDSAKRALAEAEARRAAQGAPPAREIGGRDGLDPTRYGDWEVKGIASDF